MSGGNPSTGYAERTDFNSTAKMQVSQEFQLRLGGLRDLQSS